MRVLLALILMLAAPLTAHADDLERLLDERELIRLADGLDRAVDAKDWDAAMATFADQVAFRAGNTHTILPREALVGMWQVNLFEEKTSFHLRGNHMVEIEGDTATMVSHGYAWNRLPGLEGGDFWEVWGVYTYEFSRTIDGWLITSFDFQPLHERGNSAVQTASRDGAQTPPPPAAEEQFGEDAGAPVPEGKPGE